MPRSPASTPVTTSPHLGLAAASTAILSPTDSVPPSRHEKTGPSVPALLVPSSLAQVLQPRRPKSMSTITVSDVPLEPEGPAQRLRRMAAAVRVHFTWWGTHKTLTSQQKEEV